MDKYIIFNLDKVILYSALKNRLGFLTKKTNFDIYFQMYPVIISELSKKNSYYDEVKKLNILSSLYKNPKKINHFKIQIFDEFNNCFINNFESFKKNSNSYLHFIPYYKCEKRVKKLFSPTKEGV